MHMKEAKFTLSSGEQMTLSSGGNHTCLEILGLPGNACWHKINTAPCKEVVPE